MAKHLGDKTGWLKACQKRSEELAAILWIHLKITSSCRRGQKQLFVTQPCEGGTDWSLRMIAHGAVHHKEAAAQEVSIEHVGSRRECVVELISGDH